MPAEWCGIGRDAGLECIGEPPETDRQREQTGSIFFEYIMEIPLLVLY